MKFLHTARRFLFLGLAAPVFLATLVLVESRSLYVAKSAEATPQPSPPVLTTENSFPVISAQGVYAFELGSGRVLYEKDSEAPLFPASTTKIVTALTAMDYFGMRDIVNVGKVYVGGSRMGLTSNENISVENLMYGLLVHSANDAAEALASAAPKGRVDFINAMNKKAREIGALNTHFSNPSGLDDDGQATTAKDLARIATFAMQNPEFAKIVATESYVARDTSGTIVHYLTNRNELLGKVEGVVGVKTGWTEDARENLVTLVSRGGRQVMIAVLGSQDRFGETKELIGWIYSEP